MPGVEPLRGLRIVADPAAIEDAAFPDEAILLRVAPDEVIALKVDALDLADPHAIVEAELGLVGVYGPPAELLPHIEWRLPDDGSPTQGAVAGVPAKVFRDDDGDIWAVIHAAYAAELLGRLRPER